MATQGFVKQTEHVYSNTNRKPGLKVTRTNHADGSKGIFQKHFEDGEWKNGGYKDELQPLYYDEWEQEKRGVVLCEGEKCADALRDKGFLGTTTPGGAKAWKSHYAKFFEKRFVVLIADNDTAGFHYIAAAYADIKSVAKSVTIVELPDLNEGEDVYDWFEKGHSADELKQLVKNPPPLSKVFQEIINKKTKNKTKLAELESAGVICKPTGEKPKILVSPGKLDLTVEESEQALSAANIQVYIFLGRLTKLIKRNSGEVVLIPIDRHLLRVILTSIIDFQRFDKREKDWAPTDCPMPVSEALLSKKEWPKIPNLKGLTESPLIRENGSALLVAGYDAATQLFANFDQNWPPIPEKCSLEDAQSALKEINEPFRDFPFESEADRAVILSIPLTLIQAPVLPAIPIIGTSANAAGTGKSMIMDVSCNIAYGRKISPIALSQNDEEAAKQIVAAVLSGQKTLSFDNITRPVESDLLCSLSTQGAAMIRPLGTSQAVRVERAYPILMTGNNFTPHGDMCRRTIVSALNAGCEKPEQRKFDRCPKDFALKNRQRIVSACLIIMRAHRQAGSPGCNLAPLGSFEDWSRTIRTALVWAGCADPCLVMVRTQSRDPEREALSELLRLWQRAFGPEIIRVREIFSDTKKYDQDFRKENVELFQVIESLRGRGDAVRSLSRYISKFEGRILNGLKFVRKTPIDGTARWAVEAAGLAGLTGLVTSLRRELAVDITNDTYIEADETTPDKPAQPVQAAHIRVGATQ